ncbi:MAG: fasciclin domain-containing protein [Saprospiraceae bacterium]|nr:fasciclin domain-containing protein [Saprospiraceae bacterium]
MCNHYLSFKLSTIMKTHFVFRMLFGAFLISALTYCTNSGGASDASNAASTATNVDGGQSAVQDNESGKDVVKVAAGSKDHTTLVAAVKAAGLLDELSNAGPFTVFAPTNAAFEKLPAGTVEGLLKPDKLETLQDILQYHVGIGVFSENLLQDGQSLSVANGGSITIGKKDGKLTVNGANILASVPATNGLVYVIDGVLLPK